MMMMMMMMMMIINNKVIVELMKQRYISPTENPLSYQWVANSVCYSVVTVFLLQKGWKKQGPRSLRRANNGRGKRNQQKANKERFSVS